MKKRIKLLLSIIIAGFIIFGAWKVNQVLAGCPGCTYCTGPCGVPVCGDGACTSDAVQCDTYEWVCESGEYDEHDDCIGGLEYIERCDYYEVSCPAESGCCTTICDTGETDRRLLLKVKKKKVEEVEVEKREKKREEELKLVIL